MNSHLSRVSGPTLRAGLAIAAASSGGVLMPATASIAQPHLQRLIGTTLDERLNGSTAIGQDGFVSVGSIRLESGDVNMLVVRQDGAGLVMWTRMLATDAYDEAFSVVHTSDGNIAIAGVSAADPSKTIVLTKMDLAGNVLWSNTFSGNCTINYVASFHPVVAEGRDGKLYVISHNAVDTPNGQFQFGRLIVTRNDGAVISDLQFAQAEEPPMVSPSDVVVTSGPGLDEVVAICGTKMDMREGPTQFLRSGFVTLYLPGPGFVFTTAYNGISSDGERPLDLSFSSLRADINEPFFYVNGDGNVSEFSFQSAILMAGQVGALAPPVWALRFDSIYPAQAGLRRRDRETLVWTGTHIFGDGGRMAQLQSTRIDSTQNWNFEYRYPFNSASNALVVMPPPGNDNVMFGEAFDFNIGYGQSDGYFVRNDLNGRLDNTQCPEESLPFGERWEPFAQALAFLSSEVQPPRPWEFSLRVLTLRDDRVCPTPGGNCCIADVASDSLDTVYNPNGSIGAEDLDAFIAGFIASNVLIADVASDSLDTTCNPNGAVGPEDLDAFISSFINGCP